MQTRFEFYQSLSEGDVITSVGCKSEKGTEEILTHNRLQHEGWGKYARVAYVGTKGLKSSEVEQIGIRLEGIDPSIHDCRVHVARKDDMKPPEARKANRMERRTFIKEYIKTRVEIIEHKKHQLVEEQKRLKEQAKALERIVSCEKLDVDKLLKKVKK